ncbi:Bacterial alpha-L-rhamnosidase [Pirellulimonas nuda]|uniref:alpha-L-rhamnosidase n=1 Tax=Pirellulimonas nuda TaxID=2528009 RepID=A0A518DH64_9BACT|nr:glycoside hydrolase family 78 protein [Pirellulimonas nuda]QDU90815.1 Bacterial alpha-L-rhamnosidase [Pirellulimonas nuda]
MINRLIQSVAVLCVVSVHVSQGEIVVTRQRCEYRIDPLGIDDLHPRLSWAIESSTRGAKQTAYQVLASSTQDQLDADQGDLWDSGKVASSRTIHVPYEGEPLGSGEQCFWKVRAWDRDGRPSEWSPAAQWSMGLLDESEWAASYISYRDQTPVFKNRDELFLPPARQYRREFAIEKPIRRAMVYATALGIYELHLNGQQVGDAYFAPGWTDYHQRAYYQTYDVTDLIRSEGNAIGIWVADGWYSGYVGFGLLTGIGTEQIGRYTYGKTPSVMAQIEIEYEDGTRETIGTDKTWRVTGDGPIREADFLMGEYYDATRETPGWTEPGYDDSDWGASILAEENGDPVADFYEYQNPNDPRTGPEKASRPKNLGFQRPKLEAFPGVPVRMTQEIPCQSVTRRSPGRYIFDLGQNFAGTYRLRISGPKGHRVRLRFGEMLHPDGRLMTENLRKARAHDHYICKGDPAGEEFSPRFTFHGFRYVEVSDFPGEPNRDTITGLVLHSDTPGGSAFECSDPTINRLFKNIVWTQRANFIDLPTDCPQRDERMGWTGDAQVYIGSATINADVAAFFTKWLRELMEAQRENGVFPGYAPFPFQHGHDFGSAWCDAGVVCPWTIWQAYGDTRVIEECWAPMTQFMDWRKRTSQGYLGVEHGNPWGDWLSQGEETPLAFIDTAYFAVSTRMMAEMADAIGLHDEAEQYRQLLGNIERAFAERYVLPEGRLSVDTQTAYALAVYARLIPHSQRAALGDRLAQKITSNQNRMSTGFLGTYSLLPALTKTGHHDLATFLLQSHEFPSWGYEIDQGATTIWERWDSYTLEDGFGRHNAAMNSFSHYAFGAVCEWMFQEVAGIRPGKPGYEHIIIQPNPPSPSSNAERPPIHWVRASQESIRGTIASEWRLEDGGFELIVSIPANTTATVVIPTAHAGRITESDMPLNEVEGVRLLRTEPERAFLSVRSGAYRFQAPSSTTSAPEALSTSRSQTLPLAVEAASDTTDAVYQEK